MKKLVLILVIGISVVLFQSFKNVNGIVNTKEVNGDCQYGQCSYIKKGWKAM